MVYEKYPLLPIAICLSIGIQAGFFYTIAWPIALMAFFITVIAACCLEKSKTGQSSFIMLSFLALGFTLAERHTNRQQQLAIQTAGIQTYEAVVISELAEKPKTYATDILLPGINKTCRCYIIKDERSERLLPGHGILMTTQLESHDRYGLRCFIGSGQWQRHRLDSKILSLTQHARIAFLRWRHALLERYRLLGATDESYAVLAAMTLGDKTALTPKLRDTYSITGASHVLALSGLHLGILYMFLSILTFSRRRQRIVTQVLLVLTVWAFALLAGLPVSLMRSATMISIFALFSLGHRPHMSVNLLCLTAIIFLLADPIVLYDISFQLSFMAVLSILVLIPQTPQRPVLHRIIYNCLGVSLAAQIGVAPLIAYHFGRFSTYFLLTNLIVIPAAFLILCGTLLMLIVPPAATVVLFLVRGLNYLLTLVEQLPMSSIEELHPTIGQVELYYLLVAALYGAWMVWKDRWFTPSSRLE